MIRLANGGTIVLLLLCVTATGCSQQVYQPQDPATLRDRAMTCLRLGTRYEHLASVRAQSIEALQEVCGESEAPRIREALHDESPGVRFAAAVALGTLRDQLSIASLRDMLASNDNSDRLAAIFALHRLGDSSRTGELAYHLLDSDDVTARRNAALLLGRLGEEGAVKLLTQAMRDGDAGMRANVLESLAMLGSKEAIATLFAQVHSGIGEEETFAIMSLARLRDMVYRDTFAHKLETAGHIETKLAAARALGMLGDSTGFDTARKALSFREVAGAKGDPAANRTMRVRQLAALALGAIGDERALPDLDRLMQTEGSPGLQVAAAKAILEILPEKSATPFAEGRP